MPQRLPCTYQIYYRCLFHSIQMCMFCLLVHQIHVITILFSQFNRPMSSKVVYSTAPQDTQSLGDYSPFLLHRGFFQSIRPIAGHLMMNVDITTGVMFRGGPLIDICMKLLSINNVRDLQGQQRRDILRRYLNGLTFKMIKPLRGSREKVYKITGISASAADIKFSNQEGEEITVEV